MPSIHTNRGIGRARKARAALGLPADQPLGDIVALLEQRAGVNVVVLDLGERVAGAYVSRRGRTLLFVNGAQPPARQRFTVAHEYAHHRLEHGPVIDDDAALGGLAADPREVEANAFAAEFLMPRAAVERLYPGLPALRLSLEEVVRIACAFGVSAQMARIRLETCRVLADAEHRARLDRELQEGLHLELIDRLGLSEPDDAIAAAAAAPARIPDELRASPLGRLLAGEMGVEDVAARIGRPPDEVGRALTAAGLRPAAPAAS